MKNQILLVLAVVFVACSQPSQGPMPTARDDAVVATGIPTSAPVVRTSRGAKLRAQLASQPVAAPPPTDTRSTATIALAGCSTAGGGWACPAVKRPLMATGQTPIIPPSWTVPNWYIDPQNTTTCASDSNSGTSATCGGAGIGPIVTYQELNVHRWGCQGSPSACPDFAKTRRSTSSASRRTRRTSSFSTRQSNLVDTPPSCVRWARHSRSRQVPSTSLRSRTGRETRHSKAHSPSRRGHCGRWLAGQHARRARIARMGRAHRHATEVASFSASSGDHGPGPFRVLSDADRGGYVGEQRHIH